MTNKPAKWSIGGAIVSAIGASACCVVPILLAAAGVGGAWASRLAALEPYRSLLTGASLVLLGIGVFVGIRSAWTCAPDGTCVHERSSWWLWIGSAVALAMLATPYILPYVRAQSRGAGQAESAPAAPQPQQSTVCPACSDPAEILGQTGPSSQPAAIDVVPIVPGQELVFRAETLRCPLVEGVGCGHLLAPLLARLDRLEGVRQSMSNWTGTLVRVKVDDPAVIGRVAREVQAVLTAEGHSAQAVTAEEADKVLASEQWRGAARMVDLTSYEYHTFSLRTAKAFAEREKLDPDVAARLLRIVEEQWDAASKSMGPPNPEGDAYASYWHQRMSQFVDTALERAKPLLTPEQFERLRNLRIKR